MKNPQPNLDRALDANLNRLREGVRVVEDLLRYIYNEKAIGFKLKEIRHQVRSQYAANSILSRDVRGDVLRPTLANEQQRGDLESLLVANFKRAQESARVLEECLKLLDAQEAEHFKAVRYELYALEKEVYSFIQAAPPPSPPQNSSA